MIILCINFKVHTVKKQLENTKKHAEIKLAKDTEEAQMKKKHSAKLLDQVSYLKHQVKSIIFPGDVKLRKNS